MKTFYFQVDKDNFIRDVIEYQHEGYTEVEVKMPLPIGVNGGWWKLIDGELSEVVELNPNTIENKIKSAIDDYTLELIEGGLL